MAQLSRLAQLYLKISDNLTEDDVRNLRSLLSLDEILGKAKVEKATPLEIFNMLVDNDVIGKGKLGLLVQILRCLGKGKLANEAECLEQEHEIEGEPEDTDVHCITSELASLHIKELVRLTDEPMKTPGLGPGETDASTDDAKERLGTLLAELDTPAVMADQEKQFDLYCQIGDLYRAKLYNLQSALQYYQSMMQCSKSLSEDIKQAKAHNRLGLTCDMLRKHEEAIKNHDRVVDIYKVVVGDEVDICVAYKNLASSLTLSGKVTEAKSNYKTALHFARETKNQTEEMNIYCMLGDLYKKQLNEPQISHMYYTNMLALAKDLRRKFWEMLAYNRLGNVCNDMQKNDLALQWYQKALEMSRENADTRDQIIAHLCVGALQGNLDTALQMAEQKQREEYGQMRVYINMGDMQRERFNSPRTAIQYYEQALSLARQLGDRRQEGIAYNRLGTAYVDIREYEVALEWYQKQLKICQEIEDKKEQIIAHVSVGNANRFLRNIEQAASHFNSALQLAEQTEDEHGQLRVYIPMGDMQKDQLHSPSTSIHYYEQALTQARQLMNHVEEALAYERLGLAQYEMGDYEKAVKWLQKHLDKSQDNGDNKQQISAHTNLGRAYRLMGSPEKATSHISTALQLAEQTGDLHGQMEVYFAMGEMQRDQLHSPRTAIQYYEQALALARQLGDRYKEGVAYNKLGLARDEMKEYETSFEVAPEDT
uniref:DED domain-containing protein n=1 Tax=Branchiostoma floridae TaxID=7739 RepID=C3ZRM7_BRAFL|eukprot:XP_002588816.1 hypothetical protein BRAFLDRAFT_89753 [Branchiostoma floridae]